MLRALIEVFFTIFVVILARAVLTSVLKNVAKVSLDSFQNRSAPNAAGTASRSSETPSGPQLGGELHKDPVCGTYVAESGAFRRQVGGRTVFYCSEDCRKKDAVAR
jgi:hypothetical protein